MTNLPPGHAGFMGAPTVGLEKLDSDQAEAAARASLQAYRARRAAGFAASCHRPALLKAWGACRGEWSTSHAWFHWE